MKQKRNAMGKNPPAVAQNGDGIDLKLMIQLVYHSCNVVLVGDTVICCDTTAESVIVRSLSKTLHALID